MKRWILFFLILSILFAEAGTSLFKKNIKKVSEEIYIQIMPQTKSLSKLEFYTTELTINSNIDQHEKFFHNWGKVKKVVFKSNSRGLLTITNPLTLHYYTGDSNNNITLIFDRLPGCHSVKTVLSAQVIENDDTLVFSFHNCELSLTSL